MRGAHSVLVLLLGLGAAACSGILPTGAPAGLAVSVTTDQGDGQVFREGDRLAFFVNLPSAAYVALLYEDAAGAVQQIYPAPGSLAAPLAAGDFINLPPPDADYRFVVRAPFGAELVWLLASDKPIGAIDARQAAAGAAAVREQVRTRAARNGARYGEARVRLTTRQR